MPQQRTEGGEPSAPATPGLLLLSYTTPRDAALSTSRSPDKGSIKERIKSAIAKATAGLPQEQAAPLAFSLASTAVPGARLLKRRHWSIH